MDEFERLLEAERVSVERFVRFRMSSKADADDVLQEIFLTAYQKFPQLKNKDSFKAWMRMDELLAVRVTDINQDSRNPYIRIHGKGDKERVVAITDRTLEHLEYYISLYHKADSTGVLFYTKQSGMTRQMSPTNFERIVSKYSDEVREKYPDMPEHVYPHMFRRTRTTNLYQDGVDLELVSRILGHSSTEVTRVYATPSVDMIREAMEKTTTLPEEEPLWTGKEEELAAWCGIR